MIEDQPASTQIPDEAPKEQVANKVVATKRRYFFPQHGLSLLSTDMESAHAKLAKKLKELEGKND